MLQSIQVPLSFFACLSCLEMLHLCCLLFDQLYYCKQGQLAEFRSYEGQEMQIKEKIVPLKVWLAFICLIVAHQQTVSGPLVFLYSHEWSLNIQVTAYEC